MAAMAVCLLAALLVGVFVLIKGASAMQRGQTAADMIALRTAQRLADGSGQDACPGQAEADRYGAELESCGTRPGSKFPCSCRSSACGSGPPRSPGRRTPSLWRRGQRDDREGAIARESVEIRRVAPFFDSGSLLFPHLGDWMQRGQPESQGQ